MKSVVYGVFLIASKVLDARRRGATTEAYGAIRRKEERSKATVQIMLCRWIRASEPSCNLVFFQITSKCLLIENLAIVNINKESL